MQLLTNITNDPIQTHIIEFNDSQLTFTLRFLPTVSMWFFDFGYQGEQYSGFKLSLGVRHLVAYNFPFDFVIRDTSLSGIDPFKADDFSSGRIQIFLLEPEDLAELRGYEVEI